VIDFFTEVFSQILISYQFPLGAQEIIEVGEYHTLSCQRCISAGKHEASAHLSKSLGLALCLLLKDCSRYSIACLCEVYEVE
jgi:hypothetical protein